jgi:Uma2 family endonuclease
MTTQITPTQPRRTRPPRPRSSHARTWSVADYLALETNRLIEFSHGQLEVLPMPRMSHQQIALMLVQMLLRFVESRKLGTVLFAPLRVQLWPGKFREPDIVFMRREHAERMGEAFWDGADLVMEVVSPDDRRRDQTIQRTPALRGASLLINEGDRIGLIGVNGSGKSTLLRSLPGWKRPMAALPSPGGVRIEYLPQEPPLDDALTVLETIFRSSSPQMRLLARTRRVAALQRQPHDTLLHARLLELSAEMDHSDGWAAEANAKTVLTQLGITDFTRWWAR